MNVWGHPLSRRLAFASLITALAGTASARAYHDEETRSLEESAYLLRHKEWLVGPLELGVGLWRFQLSTRVAPWVVGAALGKFMPNLEAAGTVFDRRWLTASLHAGLYYVNSRKLLEDEPILNLFVIPMAADFSSRLTRDHTLSLHVEYVHVIVDTDARQEDLDLQGGAIADNLQLHLSWEWRLTHVTALLAAVRYLPYQGNPVLSSNVVVDPQTNVDVDASLDVKDLQNSVAGSVSALFSWSDFNLRVGVAYGALFLRGPGLVLPLSYPYPEINLYWRL